jgi:hypothetical protein
LDAGSLNTYNSCAAAFHEMRIQSKPKIFFMDQNVT